MIDGFGIGLGIALGFWVSGFLILIGFIMLSYLLDWLYRK
jgi:hypothetical protein